ncbi:MAG: hypothetical protein KUG77_29060 [Nannocystaceae bacterium]|nr:hypothetical protein [Nannocystaceae bacterium]
MRRCTLALVVLALAGCRPDVHIHVDDDDDDGDTGTQLDTESGFTGSGNSSNDSTPTSNETSDSDSNPPSNTNSNGSDTDPTDGETSGGESTGGVGDTYPQPSDGACPEGFGYNADGAFEFCGPVCGEDDSCPDTLTGNVLTMCVFNPDSSMSMCVSGMCENAEENCFAGACMLPATHCAPLCSTADAECPDGMECSNNDVCRFPI